MRIALAVVAWLSFGVFVTRLYAGTQEGFEREYESTGARAGFNVVFWMFPLIGLIFEILGLLVSLGRKRD